ncbi:MAG: AAA family ATPase [Candidatus Thermoplasmatota archaeon]
MTTITISGKPGTGKTTVAKLLEKKTGLKYVYVGDLFRQLAQQHHMSLEEFGRYCEQHREIDEQLDQQQLAILKKGDVIVEGRLTAWLAHRHNIPALKIFLTADLETRANRIVKREHGTLLQRKKEIETREKSEATRYKKYYNIDITDTSIYDLIVDTADRTPEEIVECIVQKLHR